MKTEITYSSSYVSSDKSAPCSIRISKDFTFPFWQAKRIGDHPLLSLKFTLAFIFMAYSTISVLSSSTALISRVLKYIQLMVPLFKNTDIYSVIDPVEYLLNRYFGSPILDPYLSPLDPFYPLIFPTKNICTTFP